MALTPLLIAMAREPRWPRRFLLSWTAGVVYWFGVCYWIQFVLSFHGGLGDAAAGRVFLLFAVAKALHMGVFAPWPDSSWGAGGPHPRWPPCGWRWK